MQQDRLVIVLADISGYTQFMIENRTSAVHGQVCINALIEAILSHVDIPLTLQEIEGDAVFLYARDPGTKAGWQAMLNDISGKLDRFFEAFVAQLGLTMESTQCGCAICRNSDKLGLKIIVHAGEAVFHDVGGRSQVSGPDIILAHRLLKNSVDSNDYLLLTENAYQLMSPHLKGEFEAHEEAYDGFDRVPTCVRYLERDVVAARDAAYRLSDEERRDAVDGYLGWVERHIGPAAIRQMQSPIRGFSWRDRLMMVWDAVVGFRLARRQTRRSILSAQRARGRRREEWGPAAKLPP
ncbi:MAG: DUF2652 domain-containing protein [Pseudomonadales bacterium]|jgi:hypothetical protein